MTEAFLRDSILDLNDLEDEKIGQTSDKEKEKLNKKNPKIKKKLSLIEKVKRNSTMDNDGNIFEDTRKTKIVFGQYLLTRNFLAFLIFINIMISLCLYEYIAIDPTNFTKSAKFLSLISSIIQICIVLIWILSIYTLAELKKEKLIISRSDDFINDFGLYSLIAGIIFLIIHPLYFTVDVQFFIPESYYTPDTTFEDYKRPIVEYCIMIQFVVGIYFLIVIFLENIKYGNNRADRIARFFGIEADAIFVLRACMRRYPIFFVVFLEIFGIIFFGVLVRIAETNYIQHIDKSLSAEDYAAERSARILYFNYCNSFWNMIITMTTIGYGDFYVRSTLARFFIILTGFYGILVTSLLVVAFTNYLEMESSENTAYNIIKSIQVQKQKDLAAVNLTSNILRGGTQKRDQTNYLKNKTFFRQQFGQDLKNYVDIKSQYRTMNMDKTEFLTTKAFRIFSMLGKWDIEGSLKKETEENHSIIKEDQLQFEQQLKINGGFG